jgi:multidrug efflux pump subunit AcrB
MNNSPDVIETINAFPVGQIDGRTVFMRDVAHVHDGFQVQTNSVSVNGTPGALMTIRKTGGVSTLAVIDGVRSALDDIRKVLPPDVSIKALFDQSIFVRAALHSVLLSAGMAAGLTALVIILFLGNVRLSIIILAAIPLSIIIAVLFIKLMGQTLNTMTLGGFALAIGILVDNGTVVIENIERHVGMREPLHQAIVAGAGEVAIPTFLSTLCICIVFVPVFLLEGTAKYLFSPLSLSVIGSLLASLALSFTMIPVLFNHLMRKAVDEFDREGGEAHATEKTASKNVLVRFQAGFERSFETFREAYRIHRTHGRIGRIVSISRAGFLPAGGCGSDETARSGAARNAAREDATVLFGRGEGNQGTRRQRSDRCHVGQHRAAVQRHQYRPERFGHGGPDGW